MASRQQVAFQPALTEVFAEYFHHAPVVTEVLIIRPQLCLPHFGSDGIDCLQTVGRRLIRAEEAEVSGLKIQLHDVPH